MTTTRGATASLTAFRWRRYSGLTHTPKSGPARSPAFASNNGMTTCLRSFPVESCFGR